MNTPDLILAPDIPLLHPEHADFSWNGKACRIHHQRLNPGGTIRHGLNYYLVDPDGLFHEITLREIRRHLTFTPEDNSAESIALAFEKEPHQHEPDHLRQLTILCRP